MPGSWLMTAMEEAQLGLDAQQVIALRLMKIAAGGTAARTEIARMTSEKVAAATEAIATLTMGGSGRKVVRRYRTHVRVNMRRLSRSAR
jgi:hypothetical protein